MRVRTSDHFVRWANGTGLIVLGGLAWAAFGPGGPPWAGLLAAGLSCVALASAALVRRGPRAIPAEVLTTSQAGTPARHQRPSVGGTY